MGSSYVSLPWGDGYTATVNNAGGDQDNLHFSDLERDAESGTEHAQFRNYASAQGRWLSPDQYSGSYDVTNPQSMNRYAYVLNNPMSFTDPSGLGPDDGDNTEDNPADTAGNSVDCSKGDTVCVTATPITAIPVTIPDTCSLVPCLSVDGGDGTNPANPGNPYVFKINVIGTQIANLVLQRTRLLTIPFAPNNTACNIQRATSGVMGAANLGLAVGKGFALGGAVAGLGATGVGAPAAAVLAVYGTVSIFGQGLTGAAQLYSAATGNYGTAAGVAQIGNILSGPVSGLGTLLGGGSLATAERNAGYESAFTAGAGLIDAIRAGGAGLSLAMADHNTAQMSLFGAGGGNACGAGN